jgi:hypothetical protein
MHRNEVVMEGTLRPDGTLDLDEKPNLSPGGVTVVLRRESQPAPTQEDWWQFMQRSRKELEVTGHPFMNDREVELYIDWLRQEDRIDDDLRKAEPDSKKPERS